MEGKSIGGQFLGPRVLTRPDSSESNQAFGLRRAKIRAARVPLLLGPLRAALQQSEMRTLRIEVAKRDADRLRRTRQDDSERQGDSERWL